MYLLQVGKSIYNKINHKINILSLFVWCGIRNRKCIFRVNIGLRMKVHSWRQYFTLLLWSICYCTIRHCTFLKSAPAMLIVIAALQLFLSIISYSQWSDIFHSKVLYLCNKSMMDGSTTFLVFIICLLLAYILFCSVDWMIEERFILDDNTEIEPIFYRNESDYQVYSFQGDTCSHYTMTVYTYSS